MDFAGSSMIVISIASMTIEIGMDNPLAPLPRAGSARYSAVLPRLYEGDMIPISGQLYAVAELAQPRNDGSDAFIEVHRVEYERYPEDVFPPSLTAYPFPLNEDTKSRGQSGTLNGYYIFVKEIKRAQRLTDERQARVGVLEKGNPDEATPIHRWNEIAWSWVRTGDVLQLGVVKQGSDSNRCAHFGGPREPRSWTYDRVDRTR